MKIKACTSVAVTISVLFLLTSAVLAAEVSQGKTLSFDTATHQIRIEEYDTNFSNEAPYGQPTGIVSAYDIDQAKVGIPPENGDVVRIAYHLEGERKLAIKVMNVSKQDLRKK